MAYASVSDIYSRMPRAVLEGLVIDDLSGMDPSEIEAAVTAAVDGAVALAGELIDSYCRGKYPVPFSPVPGVVTRLCLDITTHDLWARRDGVSEDCRKRYTDAVAYLRDVAGGRVDLGVGGVSSAPESQPVYIEGSPRIFTRESMGGF